MADVVAAVRSARVGETLLPRSIIVGIAQRVAGARDRQPERLPVDPLTPRELDVFRLITKGYSNAEIGRELFISDTTVKTHVTRLLQKLDLRDRAQAIVLAYQTGLFDV